MTINESINAKKAELAELRDAVAADDEAAIEQAEAIMAEIDELEAKAAKAEEKKALLDAMKAASPVEPKAQQAEAKTLGEFAAKNINLGGMRSGASRSAGTDYGFKASTDVHISQPVVVTDRNVVDPVLRNLRIRSLFGQERITGTSLNYFQLGATEGAPAAVAEGAQKPQFHVPVESKTATLQKIAGWYWETDELIEDNAFLKTSIDNRGLFELDLAVENYLMTDLLGTSGIQTLAPAGSAISADDVFKAVMNVKAGSNYEADAIIINPADYQAIRLDKDDMGQYLGGGAFYAPYGNGEVVREPGLWGLNTVVSNAVAQGTCLVGAFRPAASVITKDGEGARVEIVKGDHDDRTCNRVTVIVEERIALATRIPAAFVKIA